MYPTACPKQKVSNGKRVHIFSRKKYCQLANCRFAEYNYYSSFCLSDNASYIVWSDINRIPPVHLHSLSMRRHISPSPFLKSPLYNFLPWHTLQIPYSSSMLHPDVIGRGTPCTFRLLLVAGRSLRVCWYRCTRREIGWQTDIT